MRHSSTQVFTLPPRLPSYFEQVSSNKPGTSFILNTATLAILLHSRLNDSTLDVNFQNRDFTKSKKLQKRKIFELDIKKKSQPLKSANQTQ